MQTKTVDFLLYLGFCYSDSLFDNFNLDMTYNSEFKFKKLMNL